MTTIAKYLALATLAAFLSVGCGKDDADKVAKAAADKAKVAKDAADKAAAEAADKDKVAKDLADKAKDAAATADKLKDEAEKLGKEATAMKATAEGELKPIEAKIAAMKTDADKATGDAKKDAEGKVADANGMLAKIKEQLVSLGGLKDMASFTALKDKVTGMIADLKKKVGL